MNDDNRVTKINKALVDIPAVLKQLDRKGKDMFFDIMKIAREEAYDEGFKDGRNSVLDKIL